MQFMGVSVWPVPAVLFKHILQKSESGPHHLCRYCEWVHYFPPDAAEVDDKNLYSLQDYCHLVCGLSESYRTGNVLVMNLPGTNVGHGTWCSMTTYIMQRTMCWVRVAIFSDVQTRLFLPEGFFFCCAGRAAAERTLVMPSFLTGMQTVPSLCTMPCHSPYNYGQIRGKPQSGLYSHGCMFRSHSYSIYIYIWSCTPLPPVPLQGC
jgi:hypothetical protein